MHLPEGLTAALGAADGGIRGGVWEVSRRCLSVCPLFLVSITYNKRRREEEMERGKTPRHLRHLF